MEKVYYESTDIQWNKDNYNEWKKDNIPAMKLKNKLQEEVGVKFTSNLSFDNIIFVNKADIENWNIPEWMINLKDRPHRYNGIFYYPFKVNFKFKKGKSFAKDLKLERKTLIDFDGFITRKTESYNFITYQKDGKYLSAESGLTYCDFETFKSLKLMIPYEDNDDIPESIGVFKKVASARYGDKIAIK